MMKLTIVTILPNAHLAFLLRDVLFLALAAGAWCSNVVAQEATDALREDVLEWVDQLDAPTLAQRQSAEQQLIAAGPGALAYLPESNDQMSVEAKTRLEKVRELLTQQRTAMESKAISIRLNNANTVGEALEAISRDSGVEFETRSDTSAVFTPVETPLSFWHAIDLVLDHANLDIDFYASDRESLALIPRGEERISRVDSAAYAGVYRIEPVSVTSRRVHRQPSLNALNVSIEIAWEPRLTPIGLSIPIAELAGRYDDGQKVIPQSSGEFIDISATADVCFSEFYLPLQLPEDGPRKIESLRGKIQALLPGRRESFEIPLVNEPREKSIDAMTVRIDRVRKNGELHEVRVIVDLKNASRALESHRQWIFENPVRVRRADGSTTEHLGMEVFRQTAEGVGVSYMFDIPDDLQNLTLIYESPTAVAENEVQFLIEDILLP
jgi:hypothetical protein